MSDVKPIIVVGAGVAGLCCALALQRAGKTVRLLEAADAPGGRVRTDEVDGFRLDRGFQVLLEAYPAVREWVDVEALRPGAFGSGAYLFDGNTTRLFADPLRHPAQGWRAATHPAGTPGDKLLLARLRHRWKSLDLETLFGVEEMDTAAYWRQLGFSEQMRRSFLGPFFRGIFLADETEVSARMFRFVFSMFGRGRALLPAGGMEAVPAQLAARLAPGTLQLHTPVARAGADHVILEDGTRIEAAAVVAAVGDPGRLGLPSTASGWRAVTCLYFAADGPPVKGPWLILNGSGRGRINQVAVPSQVAAGVAPPGRELISVSLNGDSQADEADLESGVRRELTEWFGEEVNRWSFLRAYRLRRALPKFGKGELPGSEVRKHEGVWMCGDTESHPSLQGAMGSGLRVARELGADSTRGEGRRNDEA